MPLGGTAVGTGINAHPEYAARACARLTELLTGLAVREAPNHFHAQATLDVAIAAHGAIRTIALEPVEDRLGHPPDGDGSARRHRRAGPARDAARLVDHARQGEPGDHREPDDGRRAGASATTRPSRSPRPASFLELNVMLPVTAVALLESIDAPRGRGRATSRDRRVDGLAATDRGPALVEQGLMLATALAPVIGYDEAAALAKEAYKSGRTIRELALERGLSAEDLDRLLDPAAMTEPGLGRRPAGG